MSANPFANFDNLSDPVLDMLEMQTLRTRFEVAVEHNLVMDFDEYADRFGSMPDVPAKEDLKSLPCEPFVYVPDMLDCSREIVAKSVIDGCREILSVYGEGSFWGSTQLMVSRCFKDDLYQGDGWLCMYLLYQSEWGSDDVPVVSRTAYVNRGTGEWHWAE